MTKKILAVLAALTMIISLAACGSKTSDETTTTEDTTSEVVSEEADTSEETTEATEAEDTEKSEESTEAEDTTTEDKTEKEDESTTKEEKEEETTQAKPQSKEEIVAYFNEAINKVKPNSKSITIVNVRNQPAGSVEGLPSTLNSLADSVISSNTGDDKDSKGVVLTSAADKKARFPVENETWSSKLTASDVKSASLTESNGKYTIKITTVADAKNENVVHGSGHAAKAFSVVMPAVINDNVPGAVKSMFSVGNAALSYPESTITVTVDAKTGNVETAKYDLYWTMYIPLGSRVVIIPFETISDYKIAW